MSGGPQGAPQEPALLFCCGTRGAQGRGATGSVRARARAPALYTSKGHTRRAVLTTPWLNSLRSQPCPTSRVWDVFLRPHLGEKGHDRRTAAWSPPTARSRRAAGAPPAALPLCSFLFRAERLVAPRFPVSHAHPGVSQAHDGPDNCPKHQLRSENQTQGVLFINTDARSAAGPTGGSFVRAPCRPPLAAPTHGRQGCRCFTAHGSEAPSQGQAAERWPQTLPLSSWSEPPPQQRRRHLRGRFCMRRPNQP